MWLKIKVWTKVVLLGLLTLYALVFTLKNTSRPPVEFWYWFGPPLEMPMLVLVVTAFALGVIGTILIRTVLKTLGQVRELTARGRSERLHREVASMKNKAAMLRTRDGPGEAPSGAPADPHV